jgi:hypothetical protein
VPLVWNELDYPDAPELVRLLNLRGSTTTWRSSRPWQQPRSLVNDCRPDDPAGG